MYLLHKELKYVIYNLLFVANNYYKSFSQSWGIDNNMVVLKTEPSVEHTISQQQQTTDDMQTKKQQNNATIIKIIKRYTAHFQTREKIYV